MSTQSTREATHIADLITRIRSTETAADIYFYPTLITVAPPNAAHDLEHLYPHTTDCITIVVPISTVRVSFLDVLLQQMVTQAMVLALVLMVVIRLLGAPRSRSIGATVILTFGICMAMQRLPPAQPHLSDKLWSACMLLITFFAAVFLSGTIYTIVMTTKCLPEIDTLDQLLASGLPVVINQLGHDDYYKFDE